MNIDPHHPANANPPNRLQARASPFGRTLVDNVNNPPDTNGPILRPRADRVCATPLRVPKLACDGAELVIYVKMSATDITPHNNRGELTSNITLDSPPTAHMFLNTNTTANSPYSHIRPLAIPNGGSSSK